MLKNDPHKVSPDEIINPKNLASSGTPLVDDIPLETVRALRDGDHLAYEKVYLKYMVPILKFLRNLTRSEELAEEITQEVFIALWEKRESIDPTKSIKNFLYIIARNSALMHMRKKKTESRYIDFSIHQGEQEAESADDIIIAKEQELLINIVVSNMPKQRRKIFELSRYEKLSHTQVAEELGISESNVRTQLTIARKEIRNVILMFMAFISIS